MLDFKMTVHIKMEIFIAGVTVVIVIIPNSHKTSRSEHMQPQIRLESYAVKARRVMTNIPGVFNHLDDTETQM